MQADITPACKGQAAHTSHLESQGAFWDWDPWEHKSGMDSALPTSDGGLEAMKMTSLTFRLYAPRTPHR